MNAPSGRRALRVVGKQRTPAEVSELLATIGGEVSIMREILRLWDRLLDSSGALEEIRGLTAAEISTALQARRHTLGDSA